MGVPAAVVSYTTVRDRFDSRSERNRFYRGLYGYRQRVTRNGKVYEYEKQGLLGDIPHIKVDDAVIIVAQDDLPALEAYLDEWRPKVSVKIFRIQLEDRDAAGLNDNGSESER